MRGMRTFAVAACIAAASAAGLQADVKTEQKGQVKFAGALGRIFSMFGGKAAKEGVVTKVALKGDRMLTSSGDTGQIVDLAEERVYDVDFDNRSYKVTTFEELRRRMREAEEKARQEQAKAEKEAKDEKSGDQPPEFEIDVATKSTGAGKAINGFDTTQVITTVTVRQKGQTLEQGGGMVLAADSWVTPAVPSMKEVAEFYQRYAQKIGAPVPGAMSAEQMAAAFAMYPMLKEALGRVRMEGEKIDGTPILSTMTFETVASPEQRAQMTQAEQDEKKDAPPTSIGGIGGMFAKKMMKKKAEQPASAESAAPTTPGHATIMTMVSETLSVSADVVATDVAIPAGFKEKK